MRANCQHGLRFRVQPDSKRRCFLGDTVKVKVDNRASDTNHIAWLFSPESPRNVIYNHSRLPICLAIRRGRQLVINDEVTPEQLGVGGLSILLVRTPLLTAGRFSKPFSKSGTTGATLARREISLEAFLVIPQPSLNNTGSVWGILHGWESLSAFCQLLSCNGHYIKYLSSLLFNS